MAQQRRWVADRITGTINRFRSLKKAARPVFHAVQDVRLGSLLSANAALHNLHAGKRCVILGTGSSLFDVDISALANEYIFSCNEIFQHPDFHKLNIDFYTVVEPFYGRLYGQQYLEDIGKLYTDIDRAFAKSDPLFFFDASLNSYFTERGLLRGKHLHYVLPKKPLLEAEKLQGDLTKRITFAEGAIFTMIAASVYMGFKELYLFGCGYTYSPVNEYHFYDVPRVPANLTQSEIESQMREYERKHPSLHVRGVNRQHNEQYWIIVREPSAGMYERHSIVKRFAEAHNVRIVNVVPDGFESPVYDKISYREFASRVAGKVQ